MRKISAITGLAAILCAAPLQGQAIIEGPKDIRCYEGTSIQTHIAFTTADTLFAADSLQNLLVILDVHGGSNYTGLLEMMPGKWYTPEKPAGESPRLDELFRSFNKQFVGMPYAIPCTEEQLGSLPKGGISGNYVNFRWILRQDAGRHLQAEESVLDSLRGVYHVRSDSIRQSGRKK